MLHSLCYVVILLSASELKLHDPRNTGHTFHLHPSSVCLSKLIVILYFFINITGKFWNTFLPSRHRTITFCPSHSLHSDISNFQDCETTGGGLQDFCWLLDSLFCIKKKKSGRFRKTRFRNYAKSIHKFSLLWIKRSEWSCG